MERIRSFPGISPSAWEHPADRAALSAFSSLPLAGELVRRLVASTTERSLRLAALANSARVSESQFASLYGTIRTVAERLDCQPVPELFVRLDPNPNASVLGVERPFILLSSGGLDLWSEEELACVLAHEVGHVLSGHVVYKTLLAILIQASSFIAGGIPLAGAAIAAARAALMEWDRKSELSADRASLLAVQDSPLVFRCLMKSAAGGRVGQMDVNEFFRQARDYDTSHEGLDSLYKLLDLLDESHPFPVTRMTALQEWEKSPAFAAILSGDYPRRGASGERDAERDWKRAGEAYASDFAASEDPLARAAGKVMDSLSGIFGQGKGSAEGEGRGNSVEEALDKLFGGKSF